MNVIQFTTANNAAINSSDVAILAKYKNIVQGRKLAVRRNGFLEFYVAAIRFGMSKREMYTHLGYAKLPHYSLEVQAINRKIEELEYHFDLEQEIANRGNEFGSFVAIA